MQLQADKSFFCFRGKQHKAAGFSQQDGNLSRLLFGGFRFSRASDGPPNWGKNMQLNPLHPSIYNTFSLLALWPKPSMICRKCHKFISKRATWSKIRVLWSLVVSRFKYFFIKWVNDCTFFHHWSDFETILKSERSRLLWWFPGKILLSTPKFKWVTELWGNGCLDLSQAFSQLHFKFWEDSSFPFTLHSRVMTSTPSSLPGDYSGGKNVFPIVSRPDPSPPQARVLHRRAGIFLLFHLMLERSYCYDTNPRMESVPNKTSTGTHYKTAPKLQLEIRSKFNASITTTLGMNPPG